MANKHPSIFQSCWLAYYTTILSTQPKKSILTTQPQIFQKTSKSTTHEHPTSILTTRQVPTSKSTTRKAFSPFRYVPTKQKNHIFLAPISNIKIDKRLISSLSRHPASNPCYQSDRLNVWGLWEHVHRLNP
jgi:hypothetical protein